MHINYLLVWTKTDEKNMTCLKDMVNIEQSIYVTAVDTVISLRRLDPAYVKNDPFQEFLWFFYMTRIRVFHLHNKKEIGTSPFYFFSEISIEIMTYW